MISTAVLQIGEIHFEGNITPHAWYQHSLLRTRAGRKRASCAHTNAILILGDIIYWYRPVIVRDEETGRVLAVKQKFQRDQLQKSYASWAKFFGLSAKQVRDAVSFLKERGLIRTELRTLTMPSGERLPNRLFVEPVVEMIRRITIEIVQVDADHNSECDEANELNGEEGCDFKVIPSDFEGTPSDQTGTSSDFVVIPFLSQGHITEITPEITPETSTENTHTPAHSLLPTGPKTSSQSKAKRAVRGVCEKSRFSLEAWLSYAQHQAKSGKKIENLEGLALSLHRSGEADHLMERFLSSDTAPHAHDQTEVISKAKHPADCRGCFGTGMEVVPGRGARRCTHNQQPAKGATKV